MTLLNTACLQQQCDQIRMGTIFLFNTDRKKFPLLRKTDKIFAMVLNSFIGIASHVARIFNALNIGWSDGTIINSGKIEKHLSLKLLK